MTARHLRPAPGGRDVLAVHFYRVRTCGEVFATGDSAAFAAARAISPPQAITSP